MLSDTDRLNEAIAAFRARRRAEGVEITDEEARTILLGVLDTFFRRWDRLADSAAMDGEER